MSAQTYRAACLLAVLTPATAIAQTPPEPDGITGEVALNGSRTTGNSSTTDGGLGLQLELLDGRWQHEVRASAEVGREDGETTKQTIRLTLQSERAITDRLYGYVNGEYFQDEIGAYKFGYFGGTGLGYRLSRDAVRWEVEAGPGYRLQKTRNVLGDPSGLPFERESEIAGRANSNFQWDVNDRVEIYNLSEVITSAADTYLWNEAGVTADMFGGLALRVSYRVDHHTDVPDGRARTDTIARAGVVYAID